MNNTSTIDVSIHAVLPESSVGAGSATVGAASATAASASGAAAVGVASVLAGADSTAAACAASVWAVLPSCAQVAGASPSRTATIAGTTRCFIMSGSPGFTQRERERAVLGKEG